jgi:putative transposase
MFEKVGMGRKQFTSEQIVGLLHEADEKLARGRHLGQICRELGITQESYYRCRMEYGEMRAARVRRLADLARGKSPPGKAAAERTLDEPISKKSLEGKP